MNRGWLVWLMATGLVLGSWAGGRVRASGAKPPGVNLLWAVDASLLTRPARARAVSAALRRLFLTVPLRVRAGLLIYGPAGTRVVLAAHRPRSHDFYEQRLARLSPPRRWDTAGVLEASRAAFGNAAGKRAVIVVTAGRRLPRPPGPGWRPGREGPAIHVVYTAANGRTPPVLDRLARISGGTLFRVSPRRDLYRTMLAALDVAVRGGRLFLVAPGGPRPDATHIGRRVPVGLKLRARHASPTEVLTGTPIQLPPGLYQVRYPGRKTRVAKVVRGRTSVFLLGALGRLAVRCLDRAGRPDARAEVIVDSGSEHQSRRRCFRPIILPVGYHRVETSLHPGQTRQVWIRIHQTTTIRFGFTTRLLVRLDDSLGQPIAVRYLIRKDNRTVGSGMTGRPRAVQPGQVTIRVLTRPRPLTVGVRVASGRLTETHLGRLARLTVQGPPGRQTFFVFLDPTDQQRLSAAQAGRSWEVLPGRYLICPTAAPSQRRLCRPVELTPGGSQTVTLPETSAPAARPFNLPLGGSFFPAAKPRPRLNPLRPAPLKLRPLRRPAVRTPASAH